MVEQELDFGQILKIIKQNNLLDFGNWTLLGKTLERVKASIFDTPIISTNAKYLKQVKQHLKETQNKKI